MMIPANPHDRSFKQVMKNLTVAKDFLTQHLPADVKALVNLDTLALTSENFIDHTLKESIADVMYTVKFGKHTGYFYCQIEHKSYLEDLCLWALMMKAKIMQRHCIVYNTKRYPLVHVMAIYHGRSPYNYPLDLRDSIDSPQTITGDYLLKPLQLIDLNTISDDQLREHRWAGLVQYVLKHIRAENFIPFLTVVVRWLNYLEEQNYIRGRFLRIHLLNYIVEIACMAEKEFTQVIRQESPEISGEIMQTLAEQWQEQGLEKGLEKGTEQASKRFAKRLLARGNVSIEEIAHLTDLNPKLVRTLQASVEVAA